MEFALGYLRWSPDIFWRATLWELVAGMDGLTASKGGQTPRHRASLVSDLRKLMAEIPGGVEKKGKARAE